MSDNNLTMEKLQGIIDALKPIPQAPTFVQSILFPNDKAITVTTGDGVFTLAGPAFWADLKDEWVVIKSRALGITFTPLQVLGFVDLIDIDQNPRERQRILTAVTDALMRAA